MNPRLVACLAVVLLLAGCGAPIEVRTDYDRSASFDEYTTFQWLRAPGANALDTLRPQVALQIRAAIVRELEAKGLRRVDDGGDLLVNFHGKVLRETHENDWGYRYGEDGWPSAAREAGVVAVSRGALVIDLLDASNRFLVWRGEGVDTVPEQRPSAEIMLERVDDAVRLILEDFPPKP